MKRVAIVIAALALFVAFLIAAFDATKVGGSEPWELAGLFSFVVSFLLPE